MKMIKLIVKDYEVDKIREDTRKVVRIPYSVKQSIVGILYSPDLRLTMREAINRKPLADSIENCQEDFIYITQEDYTKIKDSFDKTQGFGKDDVELLKRIDKAEEIDVDIKESKE